MASQLDFTSSRRPTLQPSTARSPVPASRHAVCFRHEPRASFFSFPARHITKRREQSPVDNRVQYTLIGRKIEVDQRLSLSLAAAMRPARWMAKGRTSQSRLPDWSASNSFGRDSSRVPVCPGVGDLNAAARCPEFSLSIPVPPRTSASPSGVSPLRIAAFDPIWRREARFPKLPDLPWLPATRYFCCGSWLWVRCDFGG
jgi:hypothetical protein